MDIALKKLKDILKREIGLDASTLGEATIDKILQQRMHYCQIQTLHDYYHYITRNSDELTALLETAVIPETWFFRDTRPFNLLAENIRKKLRDNPAYHCNILCIPCSTGEEPYSIAMYLLHAGIKASAFSIQAVDISSQAIKLARQGVYGLNSFRNQTAREYQTFYFDQQNGRDILKDNIKKQVTFTKMSILNQDELTSLNTKYDFIFCRNLLIYFDSNTKKTAFQNLHKLMEDDGILFIGHSEFGSVPNSLFSVCGSEQAFGLIKSSQIKPVKTLPKKINPAPKAAIYKKPLKTRLKPVVSAFKKPPKPETDKQQNLINSTADKLLNQARRLADQKKLGEAESLCFEFIDRHGDTAESFFILGLINEASGHQDMAEDFFRKSLYLNPQHYESLVHLSLLVKQQGDNRAAELLMKRAERASQ